MPTPRRISLRHVAIAALVLAAARPGRRRRDLRQARRHVQQVRRQLLAAGTARQLGSGGKTAVADNRLAEARSFTTAANQATGQAAQIQNLTLQGFDATVVNASSPTALNGAIKQACDAGIVVVVFDSSVTEPCAYVVGVDFRWMGRCRSSTWPGAA